MTVTYSDPVILRYLGNVQSGSNPDPQMCAQATGAHAGVNVQLQQLDYNSLQQWQFGSDGRIYLSANGAAPTLCLTFQTPAKDSQTLLLATVNLNDPNQVWQWNTSNPLCLENVGASSAPSSIIYFMDDHFGETKPNNQLQIYHSNFDNSQLWIAQDVSASQIRKHLPR